MTQISKLNPTNFQCICDTWSIIFVFPSRYLRSVVQNLQLIQRFKKQAVEHSPQRERLNFWMDIIVEATQGTTNRLRFPVQTHKDTNTQTRMTRYSTFGTLTYHFTLQVLILEPTKIYQPSYVSINNEAEEKNVSIWHVSPAETVRMKHNIFYTWRRRKSWCAITY